MAEITREAAVRYLLGEGAELEREALDRSLFEDESVAEQIAIFEDELIDEYVAGRLSAQERERFEKVYLSSPEHAAKVGFARALDRKLMPASAPVARSSSPHLLLLAATLALAVVGGVLVFQLGGARRDLARLRGESAAAAQREQDLRRQLDGARGDGAGLKEELDRARAEKDRLAAEIGAREESTTGIVSFALVAGLVRETGSTPTLAIPAGAKTVRLEMPSPPDRYPRYRARLETPEGRKVFVGDLATAPRRLSLSVPARLLAPGDYILTVDGFARDRWKSAADFSFRVAAR